MLDMFDINARLHFGLTQIVTGYNLGLGYNLGQVPAFGLQFGWVVTIWVNPKCNWLQFGAGYNLGLNRGQ